MVEAQKSEKRLPNSFKRSSFEFIELYENIRRCTNSSKVINRNSASEGKWVNDRHPL